jgi:DNA-binding NtrC family response regulator
MVIDILTKILVVDDDKLIRWSLKELFAQEGYEVKAVATTKEALEQAEDKSYDLIFADLEIKDENSTEMLRKMTSFLPEAKIIILSALTRQQMESQIGDLNIFSIIEKPFKSEQIKSIVKEALFPLQYKDRVGNQSEEVNRSENKPK